MRYNPDAESRIFRTSFIHIQVVLWFVCPGSSNCYVIYVQSLRGVSKKFVQCRYIFFMTLDIRQADRQIFNKMRKHALPENINYMFRSIFTNMTETCKLIQIMTLSSWKNKKLDHGLSNVSFRSVTMSF